MDPKQYPLAAAPTPVSMKKMYFDVKGLKTMFEESDDLTMGQCQVRMIHAQLENIAQWVADRVIFPFRSWTCRKTRHLHRGTQYMNILA